MKIIESISRNLDPEDIQSLSKDLYKQYLSDSYSKRNQIEKVFHEYGVNIDDCLDYDVAINDLLKTYYLNEKIIKASFIKQHFAKSKQNVLAMELPVINSRIDLAKFNGHSFAYEIKTDYDSFNRLDSQLNDYSKIFDYVYVILSDSRCSASFKDIPLHIGIYTYYIHDSTIKFRKFRQAIRNTDKDFVNLLNLLYRDELVYAFARCPKNAKKSLQIDYVVNNYSSKYINSKVKELLKRRYSDKWYSTFNNVGNILEIDFQKIYNN